MRRRHKNKRIRFVIMAHPFRHSLCSCHPPLKGVGKEGKCLAPPLGGAAQLLFDSAGRCELRRRRRAIQMLIHARCTSRRRVQERWQARPAFLLSRFLRRHERVARSTGFGRSLPPKGSWRRAPEGVFLKSQAQEVTHNII